MAATIPSSLSLGAVPPLLAPGCAVRPTAADLRFQKTMFHWVVNVAILFVAVVWGMQLLWVDNPTWGSGADMFTALIWGLGLHQIAGTGLDLTGLAEKFAK